jgi:hypothetical protein
MHAAPSVQKGMHAAPGRQVSTWHMQLKAEVSAESGVHPPFFHRLSKLKNFRLISPCVPSHSSETQTL